MSFGTDARQRSKQTSTTSLLEISKAVTSNAGSVGRQAAVIAAASGLVLTSGVAANAADTQVQREASAASVVQVPGSTVTVSAAKTAKLTFQRAVIKSTPAPEKVVEAPKVETPVVETPQAPEAPAADAQAVNTQAVNTQTEAPAAENAQAPAQAPVTANQTAPATQAPAAPSTGVASGKGAAIAAAALAQLGVAQDCTMLVTNSLRAVGINYHGWPAGYLSLGRTVSAAEAQPGDIIYYDNAGAGVPHVAVYIGNGQAVHGGWNGFTTAVFSAYLGSGPVFIRVGG